MTKTRLSAVLAALPPLLVTTLVVKLWLTGTLGYYVNARTIWVVLVGALLFALVGITALRRAVSRPGSSHISWQTVVFLVPVLVGLLVPAHPLSASTGQASSLGGLQLASHVSAGAPGDQFGYWMGAVGAHPNPSWWTGRHVTLVGFVSNQAGLPRRSFLVARFLVTCCVVDASLLGLPAEIDRGRLPSAGSWVQVSGVYGRAFWVDPSGSQWPVILHAHVSPVTIPSSPYLSP